MVNFTLPFTTNEMISISTSLTFRSWVVIYPSSPAYSDFISQLIRYARASYECFILRARRLSSKLLKQGYLVERLKSSFRKFYGRNGDQFSNMKSPFHECLKPFWSLANSDFPTDQTLHQFHDLDTELDLHRIMSGSKEHLQRVWHASWERLSFRTFGSVPFWGLACAPIVETRFRKLAVSILDFSPWIPLGTFSQFCFLYRRSVG